MKDKTFRRLLVLLTAVGSLSAIGIVALTVYLYEHCSIISFIANGR